MVCRGGAASALRSARLRVNSIGFPINYANRLIGSPITLQSTGCSPAVPCQGRQSLLWETCTSYTDCSRLEQGCQGLCASDLCGVCALRRKKELADKYCRRQAEDGVGDCAGLRLIPGATRSGKQQTPELLKGLLKTFDGQSE